MTAFPDSDPTTSVDLKLFFSNSCRMTSATAAPSTMAPSTMLAGGTGSLPMAATLYTLPV